MSNPHRGEIALELAGRRVALRPTFEALAEVEEKLGLDLVPLAQRFAAKRVGVRHLAAIVWCCWRGEDRPAYEAVGQMVVDAGVAGLIEPLGGLLVAALNGGAKKDEAPTGAAPDTTTNP